MIWDFFVIGADAAGLSAAVQIRRLKPQASIRIVNKGRFISYAACGIPYVIAGEIAPYQKLIHFTPESFKKARGLAVDIRMAKQRGRITKGSSSPPAPRRVRCRFWITLRTESSTSIRSKT
jgi:hypothetical protein